MTSDTPHTPPPRLLLPLFKALWFSSALPCPSSIPHLSSSRSLSLLVLRHFTRAVKWPRWQWPLVVHLGTIRGSGSSCTFSILTICNGAFLLPLPVLSFYCSRCLSNISKCPISSFCGPFIKLKSLCKWCNTSLTNDRHRRHSGLKTSCSTTHSTTLTFDSIKLKALKIQSQ